ncbi:MAG: ATP-binding cassette domain-containing protein, partial [Dehalococcoidales bacterium]|nr:ATP-binding cassette domain-containing protein [Dehalococcoidales bacterium]
MIELEMRDVTLGYGHHPVMERVSFRVSPGEFVGLIGPNGSGKSTLLLALLGLVPAVRGEVRINGSPVTPSRPPIGTGVVLSWP